MNAWWTIADYHREFMSGEVSALDIVRWTVERIGEVDGDLNCITAVDVTGATARAEELDRLWASGEPLGPLAGVPVVIKDNICTSGMPTGCGSRILSGYTPPFDATVVTRLKAAGAIIIAKTNMDEFGMGCANIYSVHGPTRNPWDTEHSPGGSSGGSAAAVAGGIIPASLGSDTGGSVRQPAAMCGVFGLRPTYGRTSRFGLAAFASSMDTIGPITRSVDDLARMLVCIAGEDPNDATSSLRPVPDYFHRLHRIPMSGLKVGFPAQLLEGSEPQVVGAIRRAADHLASLGAHITPVSLPHCHYGVAAYHLLAAAEASTNMARYDGVRYGLRAETDPDALIEEMYRRSRSQGLGPEVVRRILLGSHVLRAGYEEKSYRKAGRIRTLMGADFSTAFKKVDVIISPTSPITALPLDRPTADPVQLYMLDRLTIPASLVGIPALSIPAGFSRDDLPIGLQVMGPHFSEELLLAVGRHFEETTDFAQRRPPQSWAEEYEEPGMVQ